MLIKGNQIKQLLGYDFPHYLFSPHPPPPFLQPPPLLHYFPNPPFSQPRLPILSCPSRKSSPNHPPLSTHPSLPATFPSLTGTRSTLVGPSAVDQAAEENHIAGAPPVVVEGAGPAPEVVVQVVLVPDKRPDVCRRCR